jgi:hypothetical protein
MHASGVCESRWARSAGYLGGVSQAVRHRHEAEAIVPRTSRDRFTTFDDRQSARPRDCNQRSASIAAMHPEPAAVTAWR